ncbi:hypothetical protein MASR2M78_21300 [Treponema sp.]
MDDRAFFSSLAAPAQRALEAERICTLTDFSRYSKREIRNLHGIGPNALGKIENALAEAGIEFKGRGEPSPPSPLIDEYIANCPAQTQPKLNEIRAIIREAAPEAEEKISYDMPTYFLNGNLVHFAGYANHIGFYPAPSAISEFQAELNVYKNAKGSVQFPLDTALPSDLIRRMVLFRVKESKE